VTERFLLDTHVVLWGAAGQLPSALIARLDPADLYVSAVSVWEIAIKHGLGRLVLPEPPRAWATTRLRSMGLTEVPFASAHAVEVADLPHVHGDPFDRALVAVARAEDLTLVTADRIVARYPIDTLLLPL
jgi:PIN domain nuclease of toxin-antitoxin system